MASGIYYASRFGDVPMLIGSIDTERGRDVAVQSPSLGGRHSLNDRGPRLRRTSCEVLFMDQPGKEPYLDRYDRFCALFDSDEPQLFTHPIDGTYRARAEGLTVSATAAELCVRASCVFIQEDPPVAVFPVTAGTASPSGLETVTAAADDLRETLAQLETVDPLFTQDLALEPIDSDIPDLAIAQVTAWNDASELDVQEVLVAAASFAVQIDDEIVRLDAKADITRWPAYKALVVLRFEMARAAQSFTADADAVFEVFVEEPRPLLAICVEVYGAREGRDRAPEVAKLNRLRTPARVPRGTTLKMPRAA